MDKFTKKILLLVTLILGLSALLVFFVILPANKNISEHKAVITRFQTESASKEAKLSLLRKYKNSETMKEMTDKLDELWPENKNVSSLIISLDDLSKNHNTTFNNLSVAEKAIEKNKESSIQFSFSTKTDYPTLLSIIKSLENFDRFNKANQIDMALSNDGLITLQFNGEIYYGK